MSSKIRVAYVIDAIDEPLGGTEKQLMEILERLDRSRFEPWLICLRTSPWLERSHLKAVTVVLGYSGFLRAGFPGVLKKFREIIRRERLDILQTFFEDSFFVASFASAGLSPAPVRIACRRDIGMGPHRLWYHGFFDFLRPFLIKSFDGVMVNSRGVAAFVMKEDRVPEAKIKVIYNGVDLHGVDPHVPAGPCPNLFERIRADVWIGMAANLKKIKRHDVFLEALAMVRKNNPGVDIKAVLLGEGDDRPWIEARLQDLGLGDVVFLLGSVTNVKEILKAVDIGVLSSDKEGLSNAVLEYMACSLPVVATDVGGNGELVDDSMGFLVPPGQPEEMAAALSQLISNPELRRRLGKNSRRKAESLFSWERHMKELENYYESLTCH